MVFICSTFTTIDVRFDQSKKNAGKGCAKKTAMLNHKSATFVCASPNFVLVVMIVGWGYIFLPSWMRHNADTFILGVSGLVLGLFLGALGSWVYRMAPQDSE